MVGVLVWGPEVPREEARLQLAYVEPSSRRLGLLRRMLAALERDARPARHAPAASGRCPREHPIAEALRENPPWPRDSPVELRIVSHGMTRRAKSSGAS